MIDSILESIRVINLPTKTDFRSVTQREVSLFQGSQGWAEFSPFLEYAPDECVPWLVSAIEAATVSPPPPLRSAIEINATLPAVNGREKITEVLSWFPGCRVVKVKVGDNFAEDLSRLEILAELAPNARIRLDVNGRWSVEEATTYLNQVAERIAGIEYVEQPCSTLSEIRALKAGLRAPMLIAGDEIFRKSADPLALDLRGAIDVAILKVAPLGGIARAMQIAQCHDLPVVVSSALESAVGISYGLKLAASLPEITFASGLGTGALLAGDVATLPINVGAMQVSSVSPSEEALAKFAAPQTRVAWWRERIRQTWRAGAREWVEREGWSL